MLAIVNGTITDQEYLDYMENIRKIYFSLNINQYCPASVKNLMQASHYDRDVYLLNRRLGSPAPKANVAAQEYGQHVEQLPYARLLAHIYVRYMADIAGGQIIKKKLLSRDPDFPVHAYSISPKEAGVITGLMEKLPESCYAEFIAEAKVAFMYHAAVLH